LLGGALLAGVVLLSRQPVTLPPPREARALPTQTQASLTPPSPPPSQAADEVTEVPTAAPTIEPPPPKAEKKSAGRSGKPKLAKVAHALSHVAPSVSATAPAPTTVPVSPAPPPQQPQQVFAPQGGRKW